MTPTLAIRREDRLLERRCPIVPEHIKALERQAVEVVVQPAAHRAFSEPELLDAGARLEQDLTPYPVILGIKEVASDQLAADKTYLFFSHTVKGQAQNLPLLRKLMQLGCTLIDYERITDDAGQRLVFFGRFAGLAGAIDTLWALGQRLRASGAFSPLVSLQPAHRYADLATALDAVERIGRELAAHPPDHPALRPLVIGIAGSGTTSRGAQEVFERLGAVPLTPERLLGGWLPASAVCSVVFEVEHLVATPRGGFDRAEYFQYPHRYVSTFERYLRQLTLLMNCIYWEERYPRLVTLDMLRRLYASAEPRLQVIGDVSCDVRGAIQATVRSTWSDEPVYVYDVATDTAHVGFAGHGPAIMAVYNLPAELPRDASTAFSAQLSPFLPAIARADYSAPFEQLALPEPIRRAVVVHRGHLTEGYAYLARYL